MKIYTIVALVTIGVLATLLASPADASNSTWGYVGVHDSLLARQYVMVKSKWLQVVSRDVMYPAPGYIGTRMITAIRALDHARKNGGHALLYRGGPGYRNATIHLKSERGEGLNFSVEIYGH